MGKKEIVVFNGKRVRTIDVVAKEWRDKVNGNSYFSARVIVNLDEMGNGLVYHVPFRYGYGIDYIYASLRVLSERGVLPDRFACQYMSACRESGIVLRNGIERDAKKRDVTEWGRPPLEG